MHLKTSKIITGSHHIIPRAIFVEDLHPVSCLAVVRVTKHGDIAVVLGILCKVWIIDGDGVSFYCTHNVLLQLKTVGIFRHSRGTKIEKKKFSILSQFK